MGVHRAKHSFRGIGSAPSIQHQCPICQKRFFTAQLLQQHIAHHTNQLTRYAFFCLFSSAEKHLRILVSRFASEDASIHQA